MLGALGCAAVAALPPLRRGAFEHGMGLLGRHFGPAVAADPQTARFMEDYLRLKLWEEGPVALGVETYLDYGLERVLPLSGQMETLDTDIVQRFVLSTNVLDVVRSGARLGYDGFYDPYERPCANPLSLYHMA
jgi:hypothetical protein